MKPIRASLSSILKPLPRPGRPAFCSTASPKPRTPLYDGPDSSLLRRKLKWLVEDAVEQPDLIWAEEDRGSGSGVPIRASLEELYRLWKQRIEERRPFQCEHWRDLIWSVEERVLIPRPETEIIVARVLGGGGRVVAVELSSVAVTVVSYNLQRYRESVSEAGVLV